MTTTPYAIKNQSKVSKSLRQTPVIKSTSYSTESDIKANQKYFGRRTDPQTMKSTKNSYVTPFRMLHIIADFTTVKAHPDSSGTLTRKLITNNNAFTIERGKLCQELIEENDKALPKNLYAILEKINIQKSPNENAFSIDNHEMQKVDTISLIEPNLSIETKDFIDKCGSAECISLNMKELRQNENNYIYKEDSDNSIIFKSKNHQNSIIEAKSFKLEVQEINDIMKKSPMISLDIIDKIFQKEDQFLNLNQIKTIKNETYNFDYLPQIKSISVQKSEDAIILPLFNSIKNDDIFSDNSSKKSNIANASLDSNSFPLDLEIKENDLNDSISLIKITDYFPTLDQRAPFLYGNSKSNILTETIPEINDRALNDFENTDIDQKNHPENSNNIPTRIQNKIRKRDLFESNLLTIFNINKIRHTKIYF